MPFEQNLWYGSPGAREWHSGNAAALRSDGKCKNKMNCGCTRSFKIDGNYYGCTFDGIMFQSPMKAEVVDKVDHIVHLMVEAMYG